MPYPIWPRDHLAGESPVDLAKTTTATAFDAASGGGASGFPPSSAWITERERFSVVLTAADLLIDTMATALEVFVDPHNEKALSAFFAKMAKGNITKKHLLKYAAGTGFAKALKALATISRTATNTCTREMATAAHDIATTNADTTNAGADPELTPYLCATRAAPRPMGRLPTAHHTSTAINDAIAFSSKLRARMTDR